MNQPKALPPMSQPYPMRSEIFGNGTDIVDGNDAWALMMACASGDAENANRHLLDHGADPRIPKNAPWARPTACAERYGHDVIIKRLQKK
jgi:hypothetical protein